MMPDTHAAPDLPDAHRVVAPDAAILCETPALARLCAATLERAGLSPWHVPPASDALCALKARPPALLLVLLIGRDPAALALCQAVGQDPAFASTRLVIVQDSARDIDLRRAWALGADAVLPLPLDPAALAQAARPLAAIPA
jgi:CheY-like chemotaxis protein